MTSIIIVYKYTYAYNSKLIGIINLIIGVITSLLFEIMLILMARWNYSIIVVEPTIIIL